MARYKSLRELCLEVLGPPDPSRRPIKPPRKAYGEAKKERLDLHAQMMRERFGDVEEYEAERRQKPKSWIEPPNR